jgi:hypothetical protein
LHCILAPDWVSEGDSVLFCRVVGISGSTDCV